MSCADHIVARNSERRAQWLWRWHLQGGSTFVSARPMLDLRNGEDLRRGRIIEFKVRRLRKGSRGNVINLAAWRIGNARRKTVARAL